MKTIIAGTDFTPSSDNACKYAALLAQKLNCKLTLFNMFDAPLIHSNAGLYGVDYVFAKADSQHNMYRLVDALNSLFPKVKVEAFVTDHSFKSELVDFIARHRVVAAVMGLGAKNRISKFIDGSRGVNIAGKIKTPVIIVPERYKVHKLSHALLAVDNSEKLDKSTLKGFGKFATACRIKLQLLHVRTEDEIFDPLVHSLTINGKKKDIAVIKASCLEDGVQKYCKDQNIDLVAIISKRHSVFYNLFVESNTKKMAFASKVPVLAVHE